MGVRKLPPPAIRAAATLYRAGMSMHDIAEQIWERYGYADVKCCEVGIGRALKFYGVRRRNHREAKILSAQQRGCRGCGCHPDDRSYACHQCAARHYTRKSRAKRGLATVSPLRDADVCAGGATTLLEAA